MINSKRYTEYSNDLENLTAAEMEFDEIIISVRKAHYELAGILEVLTTWKAGEGAKEALRQGESLFDELTQIIHQLQDSHIEVRETKEVIRGLKKLTMNSGPKW